MADAHAAGGQQHPLKIYFFIWGLLFLFSAASYATDFLEHGYFRWGLILLFMVVTQYLSDRRARGLPMLPGRSRSSNRVSEAADA